MSSGPGVLQKKILDRLKSSSPIFYNQLLWEIAFERDEIETKSKLSPHIEKGTIRKSFKENFRRSIKSLEDNKVIIVEKRKLTDIDDAFRYFPYHTEQLEIYQLRQALLPSLKDYIIEENPQKFGDSKIENELILRLKDRPELEAIKAVWRKIEREIISILDVDSPSYDIWIQILVRGRYLFLSKSIDYKRSFVSLYANLKKRTDVTVKRESEILTHIKEFIENSFDKSMWNLGKTKSVYYSMANMRQYSKDSLNDDVKSYLLDKRAEIVKTLPDHKEPKKLSGRGIAWGNLGHVKYSDYMDQIITRQILRNQKIILLN